MSASRVRPGERLAAARVAQIDEGRELAAPVVDHQRHHLRQVRGGDQQHVGAMRRERAPAHRSRDHAREVEHAHARQRPVARRQRLRRRIADLLDREYRQRARRRGPGACASHSANERVMRGDQSGFRRGGLERLALPAVERALHRFARIVAAEQLQHAVAVMREIGVQPHPAPVAAAIEPGDLVPDLARLPCRRRACSARCEIRSRRRACRR